MRTPARWYGAKGWLVKHLLPLPEHRSYVEVFGGAGTLLFAIEEPSPVEVYNDIDGGLVNFFGVLQDRYRDGEDGRLLRDLLMLTPHSREEYIFCRQHWNAPGIDDIERARRFFVVMHQSFSGGTTAGWRFSKDNPSGGMSPATNRWLGAIDRLPEAINRLRRVQIDGEGFEKCIKRYDDPKTLFYLDPPYVHSERVDKTSYKDNEMDDDQHRTLVASLLQIEGMAILSGYDHEIYAPLVAGGWRKRIIVRANMAARVKRGDERGTQEECVWFSPNYPKTAIHVE